MNVAVRCEASMDMKFEGIKTCRIGEAISILRSLHITYHQKDLQR
jgi:hypothetical protein